MGRALPGRGHTVVTVTTITGNAGVIKVCGQPAVSCVAVLTYVAGSDMGRVLSGGRHSIVTTAAISDDAHMVEIGRYPSGSRVAVITGIGTGYVGRVLAGGGHTIVTGSTAADDLRVIDRVRWHERDDAMAIFANCRGLNVCRVLAGRIRAVVTTDAIACDIDVVKIRRRPGHS